MFIFRQIASFQHLVDTYDGLLEQVICVSETPDMIAIKVNIFE